MLPDSERVLGLGSFCLHDFMHSILCKHVVKRHRRPLCSLFYTWGSRANRLLHGRFSVLFVVFEDEGLLFRSSCFS